MYLNQWRNCEKCLCNCKKHHLCEKKLYSGILVHAVAKMENI